MIFMNRFSRSSRATGPKMRVPRGFSWASMITTALLSNRRYEPSARRNGDLVRTTTQVTTTGFTANVYRSDSNSSWGQSLQLDWMAWDGLGDLSWLGALAQSARVNLYVLHLDRAFLNVFNVAERYPTRTPIEDSHLYVSRGIGTTFTPVRLNARPEITVFNLT